MTAEIEFKREMNRNYLVMEPESGRNEKYAVRMLTGNQIAGFLLFHEKQVNGETKYYYDVTSKQPLARILEYRNLTGTELERLLSDLLFALKQLERFLLDENSVSLKPELIYVEPDTFKSFFCFIPGHYEEFPEGFCELTQYLLDHVNHRDGEAVVLAFSVFRESRKENFGMEDIERCLKQKETAAGPTAGPAGTAQAPAVTGPPDSFVPGKSQESSNMPKTSVMRGREEKRETEPEKQQNVSVWLIAALLAALLVSLTAAFLFFGADWLLRYKWLLGGAGLCIGAVCVGVTSGQKRMKAGDEKEDGDKGIQTENDGSNDPWEIWFGDEDEEPENEDECRTVLLTARPVEQECRKLTSVTGNLEISMGYFPFLIGKSKGIVDFCLNEPGVSRLHVKIEEAEGRYAVTDLNSTNGTRVNGRMLESNETCDLPLGSELEIAGRKFRFQ